MDSTHRRLNAIDMAFPYLADHGRVMSQRLVYELGILVSCMRLGTVNTPEELLERLRHIEPKTDSDQDVLAFIAAGGSAMVTRFP